MSKPKKRKPSKAERADIHDLYQHAVQDPTNELDTFDRFFKRYRKRKPRSLKEDFCGTALFATEWVKLGKKRWAVGVDLDGPTLEWGREHNVAPAGPSVARRLQLHQANVLDVHEPPVDIVCALNYSYCVFKTRADLTRYFRVARQSVGRDGIFICDIYGGTEAVIEHTDPRRKYKGFSYEWQQAAYDPITHHTRCHINFYFADGSSLQPAFSYDWRLWTVPEIRECLADAGFAATDVWWDDGDEDSWYQRREAAENQPGWLAYIIAYD
ncbi:MAG: class I SAM-dependent methyltransferase [Myxococcota bacterium]